MGSKAKNTCACFPDLHFYPFVYFSSHVLSNCIALLGSIALLAKARICDQMIPFYINVRIDHVLGDHRKINLSVKIMNLCEAWLRAVAEEV